MMVEVVVVVVLVEVVVLLVVLLVAHPNWTTAHLVVCVNELLFEHINIQQRWRFFGKATS